MASVVLFHSALGLRPAVHTFADALRARGHVVHTPDLFEGKVFDDLEDGIRQRDVIGIGGLIERAQEAVSKLPSALVYAGFSMGAAAAQFLAATRPGALGAVLMHAALPPAMSGSEQWPQVPVQVHYAQGDPWVDAAAVEHLGSAVQAAGQVYDMFVYDGTGHLFADPASADYDAAAAASMRERVTRFMATISA